MTFDVYAQLAKCDGFDWDEGNAPKVRARHRVAPGECEQVFFGAPLLVSADLKHSQTEAHWRTLGMTLGRRAIYLVFTLRGRKIRVLAARNMNRKERRDYMSKPKRALKKIPIFKSEDAEREFWATADGHPNVYPLD